MIVVIPGIISNSNNTGIYIEKIIFISPSRRHRSPR